MASITREQIAAGLRELGLSAGDRVMVHSSLKSFGRVAGGAGAVIGALQDVLTEEGTLLMPSFNHGDPWREGGPGIFDPLATPTRNGRIPDTFWRMPGVHRSWDPTHPFAARGRRAEAYTQWHHRTLTMGPDSPLGMLWREGGQCLFLGIGHGPNTFKHVVETTTGAPCLGRRTEAYLVRLPDGRIVEGRGWGWRERSCPLTDVPDYIAAEMKKRRAERRGKIGNCEATLFSLQDCFEVIRDILQEGRDEHPPCARCPIRPRAVAQTRESDWDDETGRLKPDSVALMY